MMGPNTAPVVAQSATSSPAGQRQRSHGVIFHPKEPGAPSDPHHLVNRRLDHVTAGVL